MLSVSLPAEQHADDASGRDLVVPHDVIPPVANWVKGVVQIIDCGALQ